MIYRRSFLVYSFIAQHSGHSCALLGRPFTCLMFVQVESLASALRNASVRCGMAQTPVSTLSPKTHLSNLDNQPLLVVVFPYCIERLAQRNFFLVRHKIVRVKVGRLSRFRKLCESLENRRLLWHVTCLTNKPAKISNLKKRITSESRCFMSLLPNYSIQLGLSVCWCRSILGLLFAQLQNNKF